MWRVDWQGNCGICFRTKIHRGQIKFSRGTKKFPEPWGTRMQNQVGQSPNQKSLLVCLLLFLGTLVLYWPTREFEFVGYDDPFYVTSNPYVQQGVTAKGIAWAF